MSLSVNISKQINGFRLNVNWKIENELAVLFGYSGAGKSLTLQSIAGLVKPDAGRIESNGKVLFDSLLNINVTPQQRNCGYVFQDLALFPHMKVKENIAYGLRNTEKSEVNIQVNEMLNKFYIEEHGDKYPSEISGGQRQRVALARVIIGKPSMLLLDEPFSALDNRLRAEMRNLLLSIRSQFNIPIILVTHDVLDAWELADKIIVYTKGKITKIGKPTKIFKKLVDADLSELLKAQLTLTKGLLE